MLRELKKMGSGADVVSVGEILKAMKAVINAKKIVLYQQMSKNLLIWNSSWKNKKDKEEIMIIRKQPV